MDIKRSGLQPSGKGQAEYFTDTVRICSLFQAKDPARVVGGLFVPLLRLKAFYAAACCRLNGLILSNSIPYLDPFYEKQYTTLMIMIHNYLLELVVVDWNSECKGGALITVSVILCPYLAAMSLYNAF